MNINMQQLINLITSYKEIELCNYDCVTGVLRVGFHHNLDDVIGAKFMNGKNDELILTLAFPEDQSVSYFYKWPDYEHAFHFMRFRIQELEIAKIMNPLEVNGLT